MNYDDPDDFDLIPAVRGAAPPVMATIRPTIFATLQPKLGLDHYAGGGRLSFLQRRRRHCHPTRQVGPPADARDDIGSWFGHPNAPAWGYCRHDDRGVLLTATGEDATPTPRQTLTAAPTPSPTAPPTPCASQPANFAAPGYNRDIFGCPRDGGQTVWAAWEPFERGSMLWRSDSNRSYFFTLGGQWQVINASWNGDTAPSRGDPPPDRANPNAALAGRGAQTMQSSRRWAGPPTAKKASAPTCRNLKRASFCKAAPSIPARLTISTTMRQAVIPRPVFVAAHNSWFRSGALGGNTVVAAAPANVHRFRGGAPRSQRPLSSGPRRACCSLMAT